MIGIDNKHDLPQELMKTLYYNIVNNEIKMNEMDNVYKVQEICAQISGKLSVISETLFGFNISEYRASSQTLC